MKKQGYTLIELLVSVVIFALFLAILSPSVRKMIDNSCHSAYLNNLSLLKSAARNYALRSNLKINNGAQKIIFMTQLVDDGIINDIIDPKTKDSCTGYVIVHNNNDVYKFTPYMDCGGNYTSENYGTNDTVPPELAILGDSEVTINIGEAYVDAGATATDNADGDISSHIVVLGTPNINVLGRYTITYSVEDSLGNTASATRTVNVVDTYPPIITFNPNGKITYSNSIAITINATDLGGVNNESLKYLWTTSDTEPTLDLFVNTFNNNQIITTPAGLTGNYYLWVLARDLNNNQVITKSNVFNLDNIAPTITLNGDSTVTIVQNTTYTDAGAMAIDNIDGDITPNIVVTSTVNPGVPGTYTVTYNVSDTAGNAAMSVVRTVIVSVLEFDPNSPILATGMTPIKWDGGAWITTTTSDTDWYSYTSADKKWANAQTADGSMWVWIPRYIYKISSGWHSNITGTIDVKFSQGIDDTLGGTVTLDTDTTSNASNNKWTDHPAFTFGAIELSGVWVAKFEASGTTSAVNIIPSVASLRSLTIGSMFDATRNMETNSRYGWGTTGTGIDTHLMKNTEWGAVAYFAQSQYGKNSEVWINPSSTFITGCAGTGPSVSFSSGCSYYYNTSNGQQASTTGNIYGIYDISGGGYEYVAAYINKGHANLATYGSSIINADAKYRDSYISLIDTSQQNYVVAEDKKGDAVFEVSNSYTGSASWYSDSSVMPTSSTPWFTRGSAYSSTTTAGLFSFRSATGNTSSTNSFRPVLAIDAGL